MRIAGAWNEQVPETMTEAELEEEREAAWVLTSTDDGKERPVTPTDTREVPAVPATAQIAQIMPQPQLSAAQHLQLPFRTKRGSMPHMQQSGGAFRTKRPQSTQQQPMMLSQQVSRTPPESADEDADGDADIVVRVARMMKANNLKQTQVGQESRVNLSCLSQWLRRK